MPPRRSQRQKRPSQQALESLVSVPSRRRRHQQPAGDPGQVHEDGLPVHEDGVGSEHRGDALPAISGSVSPPASSTALPPGVLQHIIATVTAEVTKKLGEAQEPTTEAPVASSPEGVVGQAETSLQGAIASFQSSLAGEALSSSTSTQPKDIFSSISIPADARVPLKLKTKIWEEQYIDFGSLLVTPVHNGRYQLTLQHLDEGSAPSLTLEPFAKPKKISPFDSWLPAFHVFVAVYSSKHPQAAPGLMKYGSIIQDLATTGHNWRYYDENFRLLRQSPSTAVPWGNVHWELWLMAQNSSRSRKPPSNAGTGKLNQAISVPRGYCFKYHRGGECSGCSFKHTCCKCEGPHRALHCNFRGFNRNPGNKSQTRGSPKPSGGPSPSPGIPRPVTNTHKN